MDSEDHRAGNPFTEMEGYAVLDASGAGVGRVEDTVYDAVSNVLKYIVVGGRPIPADDVDVDAEAERVTVPHDRSTIETAPEMQDLSGAFDAAVREHYGETI
ncbi:MAG: PRC-barrel domain-containing protein [Actinomycetota bacterium]|nr:PRC-barrel domain-containing protein [Actinomycetota bacterium]